MIDADGNEVTDPKRFTIEWDVTAAQKGGYPSFMAKEIHEQAGAIADTLLGRLVDGKLQLDEKETRSFEHLLTALRYGAPPHGGFAFGQSTYFLHEPLGVTLRLGFDRLMAVLCNTASIRDVIAFPKTAAGTDLLFKSPSPSTDEVLAQYALRARST